MVVDVLFGIEDLWWCKRTLDTLWKNGLQFG